jgi:hypothetical protein
LEHARVWNAQDQDADAVVPRLLALAAHPYFVVSASTRAKPSSALKNGRREAWLNHR